MTVSRTPFGWINEINQPCDEYGNLLARSVVDNVPTPAVPPVIYAVADPSLAHTSEAKTDDEAARFTQLHALTVERNGICVAHKYWETRTRLEQWEANALADDFRKLINFVLPSSGVTLTDAGVHVTPEDAMAITRLFPNRRVYFVGVEVKVQP